MKLFLSAWKIGLFLFSLLLLSPSITSADENCAVEPSHCVPGDPDCLWKIINEACVPNQISRGSPSPCKFVDLTRGQEQGWAILKDRKGAAQFLLIPTRQVAGIGDPVLVPPVPHPNYWQAAWEARERSARCLSPAIDNDLIGLAVNSGQIDPSTGKLVGHSQNQLHIHIDCIRGKTMTALKASLAKYPAFNTWTPFDVEGRNVYERWSTVADTLQNIDVFKLVSDRAQDRGASMISQTIAVVPPLLRTEDGFSTSLRRPWTRPTPLAPRSCWIQVVASP